MKFEIIESRELKSKITEDILRDLPLWFGIEESTLEYIEQVKDKVYFAVKIDGEHVGFYAIEDVFPNVANMYVLGLKKRFHRQGIGEKLYYYVENYLMNNNYDYVTVHTLSERRESDEYKKTRLFYRNLGFKEVFESDKIWDENNPFLLMVKKI